MTKSILTIIVLNLMMASCQVQASSSFGLKKVEKIMIHDSGTIRVYLEGSASHTETCDYATPFILDENHKFFKEMYSGLLAALQSKTSINGYVSGCITSWAKTYPRIVRIDFY